MTNQQQTATKDAAAPTICVHNTFTPSKARGNIFTNDEAWEDRNVADILAFGLDIATVKQLEVAYLPIVFLRVHAWRRTGNHNSIWSAISAKLAPSSSFMPIISQT
jgi:hypothetical protein